VATWDFFFPHILPQVRGCADEVVEFHLRQAAIEFCRRSQCWKQELPITTTADVTDYELVLPTDAAVSLLLSISVLDTDGIPNDEYDIVNATRGRDMTRNFIDGCFVYLSDDETTLTVQPPPEDDGMTLLPYVSLKPTQTSAGLPDFIANQHTDVIAAGALARLLAMPKTGWRDPAEAAVQRAKFLGDTGSASVVASRGRARARVRTKAFLY